MRCRWWLIAAIGIASTVIACSNDPCFGIVALNPQARTAIIFDQCRGLVEYQNLPPMTAERAVPQSATPSTSTTLPRTEI